MVQFPTDPGISPGLQPLIELTTASSHAADPPPSTAPHTGQGSQGDTLVKELFERFEKKDTCQKE